jgi:hypothetical protein
MAGMSVVDKFINSLTDVGDHYNILVDLLGFDGWPAAFVLNEISKGNRWAAGTVCHTAHETAFVAEITSNKIFSFAREGPLALLYIVLHKSPQPPA